VSRPLRTIVLLAVMGLVAVAGLLVMAGRMRTQARGARHAAERQVVPAMPDRGSETPR
jgi:hypothetical protein